MKSCSWHRLFQNWGICPLTPSHPSRSWPPILCPPSLGLTMTLGQVSSRRVITSPWLGVGCLLRTVWCPPSTCPCPSPHLRGAQKSLREGCARHGPLPRSPHQHPNHRDRGAPGDPLAPHGPPGSRPWWVSMSTPLLHWRWETASTGRTKPFSRPSGARKSIQTQSKTSGLW